MQPEDIHLATRSIGSSSESSNNDRENPDRYPYQCICGAEGRNDRETQASSLCAACQKWQHNDCVGLPFFAEDIRPDYLCYNCKPDDFVELLATTTDGAQLRLRNNRVREIKGLLHVEKVGWFWPLYDRLTDENIDRFLKGKKLQGKSSSKVTTEYQEKAKSAVHELCQTLDHSELDGPRTRMSHEASKPSGLYTVMRHVAEAKVAPTARAVSRERFGVLAEFFGWCDKSVAS